MQLLREHYSSIFSFLHARLFIHNFILSKISLEMCNIVLINKAMNHIIKKKSKMIVHAKLAA
jgi:hypothetical protein